MSDSAPDLGAMVSKLLGDPALLSQIASTVGLDAPPAAEDKAPDIPPSEAKEASVSAGGIDQILPMLSMIGSHGNPSGGGFGNSSRRCALLSALKPFCNEHRCRTIDYMIGISKLSETLTQKRG